MFSIMASSADLRLSTSTIIHGTETEKLRGAETSLPRDDLHSLFSEREKLVLFHSAHGERLENSVLPYAVCEAYD